MQPPSKLNTRYYEAPLPEAEDYHWANRVNVSKHAPARVARAKARKAKRRRTR